MTLEIPHILNKIIIFLYAEYYLSKTQQMSAKQELKTTERKFQHDYMADIENLYMSECAHPFLMFS